MPLKLGQGQKIIWGSAQLTVNIFVRFSSHQCKSATVCILKTRAFPSFTQLQKHNISASFTDKAS